MKKYIISNETEITEKNVQTWLEKFTSTIQPHLLYLDSFYQGEDEIISYPYEKRDVNSQIHVNLRLSNINIVSYGYQLLTEFFIFAASSSAFRHKFAINFIGLKLSLPRHLFSSAL